MKLFNLLFLLCLVVLVTVDGAYVGYDAGSDVAITVTVNGDDVAMQEVSGVTGQIIMITIGFLQKVYSRFVVVFS